MTLVFYCYQTSAFISTTDLSDDYHSEYTIKYYKHLQYYNKELFDIICSADACHGTNNVASENIIKCGAIKKKEDTKSTLGAVLIICKAGRKVLAEE